LGVLARYQSPAISPDGKRIAVHRHDGTGGDVWIVEEASGKMSRLTFDASQDNSQPIWSADGSRIVFGSRRNGKWGMYQKLSNGTGGEELLFESDAVKMPMSWSGAINTILFYVSDPKNANDVWALPLTGDRKPFPVLQTSFAESHPQISPDGKWLAYSRRSGGVWNLWLSRMNSADRRRITNADCNDISPRWEADSRTLLFASDCGRAFGLTALYRKRVLP